MSSAATMSHVGQVLIDRAFRALGYFALQQRKRVLIPAFTRAMRDPFPPARLAGLLALQGGTVHTEAPTRRETN